MESIVDIQNLSRRFRRVTALDDFTLSVSKGRVLGLVGENGAGKTTLIKHILGMLRAQTGMVRVLGKDPIKYPVEVLGRIGYLSENRDMPGWMRIDELKRYCKALYPNWDTKYALELSNLFELDPTAKLRTLSMGQTAKAGLMTALAHRPDLLVLDEPSSGLDPIVRKDILSAIFRTVAEEGRTVLFSSHLLEEVEMAADDVAMVHGGKLILFDKLEQVMADHRRVVLRSSAGNGAAPKIPGTLVCRDGKREGEGEGEGDWEWEWELICASSEGEIRAAVGGNSYKVVSIDRPTLDEIFMARSENPLASAGV